MFVNAQKYSKPAGLDMHCYEPFLRLIDQPQLKDFVSMVTNCKIFPLAYYIYYFQTRIINKFRYLRRV